MTEKVSIVTLAFKADFKACILILVFIKICIFQKYSQICDNRTK